MTEYGKSYAEIRATGADVVALSVDGPERSQPLRAQLGLEFPILCDPDRAVVRAWDLYNAKEKGGIAIPAVFVISGDLRIRYASVDGTARRVSTKGVLAFLRGEAAPSERAAVRVGLGDFARAFGNALRRGLRSKPH